MTYARRFALQTLYPLLNLLSRPFQAFQMRLLPPPLFVTTIRPRRILQRPNLAIHIIPKPLGLGQALDLANTREKHVE